MDKTVIVVIDGIGLNATHFAAFGEEIAVKKMIADGITKNEKWAANAYKLAVAAVNKNK
jgi:hypothetical protein